MYTAFASVYDLLMADVDYSSWADFYRLVLGQYGIPFGKVCECACGTGSLTLLFSSMGYQMTGVDLSPDMLFEASQKARRQGAMIPFVKQDMCQLHLHRQMDAVLCTNDGVNYLKDAAQVQAFFTSAYHTLRPGGVLVFDVSTPYKLKNILGDSFLGDETEDIAYLWRNHFSKARQCVELDLAIFLRQKDGSYQRIGEHQRQYAHEAADLEAWLLKAGFTDIAIYGDKRLATPAAKENRWHIAAKKPAAPEPLPQYADHAQYTER